MRGAVKGNGSCTACAEGRGVLPSNYRGLPAEE